MTVPAAKKLNQLLFDGNPFARSGDYEPAFVDEGWASYPEVLDTTIDVLKPKVIVEIGTWLGQSTFNMLERALCHDPEASIICVDTWLGSPEHWFNPEWKAGLRLENGRPNIYPIFIDNVCAKGFEDYIVPLNMTSLQAAKILHNLEVSPDLIYLDGAHDKDEVLADIENYWPFLNAGGCMVGDDYCDPWPGVVEAVHEFKQDRTDLEFQHARDKFVFYKI